VRAIYGQAKTYQDSGVMTSIYYAEGDAIDVTTVRFNTAFRRPTSFRFEYDNVEGHCSESTTGLILQSRSQVFERLPGAETFEQKSSIGEIVGEAVGVTGGSAAIIHGLLVGSPWFFEQGLSDGLVGETSYVKDRQCHHVLLHEDIKTSIGIWIDESYLLRKVAYRRPVYRNPTHVRGAPPNGQGNLIVEDVTYFDPMIDVDVPEPVFEMSSPANKSPESDEARE